MVPISHLRCKEENIGNDNEAVVSDENDTNEVKASKTTTNAVRISSPRQRKKLRVSRKHLCQILIEQYENMFLLTNNYNNNVQR